MLAHDAPSSHVVFFVSIAPSFCDRLTFADGKQTAMMQSRANLTSVRLRNWMGTPVHVGAKETCLVVHVSYPTADLIMVKAMRREMAFGQLQSPPLQYIPEDVQAAASTPDRARQ